MGLGGFLAAKSELDHYLSEKKREEREVVECPDEEEEECFEVLAEYGITREVPPFPFLYISLVLHDTYPLVLYLFSPISPSLRTFIHPSLSPNSHTNGLVGLPTSHKLPKTRPPE